MDQKPQVIILMGPTATGKTGWAVRLAQKINGEIVSADSRQVYRSMDIGTGKDLEEYGPIPYHLIDIVDAGEEFSVSDFQRLAWQALEEINGRNLHPIICGGTGHYIKALIDDYKFVEGKTDLSKSAKLEEESREHLEIRIKDLNLWDQHHWRSDSKRRMARAIEKAVSASGSQSALPRFSDCFDYRIYYIELDRETIKANIYRRLVERLEHGMIEEVKKLIETGISHNRLERYGLEYRYISYYLRGHLSYSDCLKKLHVEISRFAKRQMTFIRYMQKSGHHLEAVSSYQMFERSILNWLLSNKGE